MAVGWEPRVIAVEGPSLRSVFFCTLQCAGKKEAVRGGPVPSRPTVTVARAGGGASIYIYKRRVLPLEGYATAHRVTGGIHSGWTFLTIAMEQQVKSAAEKTVSVGHCVCLHSRLSTQLRLLICFGMSGDRRGSGPIGEMHSIIPPTPMSRNFHKKKSISSPYQPTYVRLRL